MSFTLTPLAGFGVLVEGTDIRGNKGTEILDSSQWDDVKARDDFEDALSLVDNAIAELLAPVTAAMEAANEKLKAPDMDPLLYVVDAEGVDAVEGEQRMLTKLERDSVILRAIETGADNRLIWVNDMLVLTAAPVVVTEESVVD